MNYFKRFHIKPGSRVKLHDIDPNFTGKHLDEEQAKKETERNDKKLRILQELLYAERRRSLLICLQAMDAGGKDGVINHVLGAMNPQGCRVYSFKQPTDVEQAHDFLWRSHRDAPAKGEVVIFNRSHYESVLVERVHDIVPKKIWSKRYEQINALEKILNENGTHILKFYLHISKDEQLKRFKARLDDETKHWKINERDFVERQYWDAYIEAFQAMLEKCSTDAAPWFVIPANHKWFRNLAISRIVADYMEGLNMKYPQPSGSIQEIRRKYFKARR